MKAAATSKNQEFFDFGAVGDAASATEQLGAPTESSGLFGDEPVPVAKKPRKRAAVSGKKRKLGRWVPPDDFSLPDGINEAGVLRRNALASFDMNGPRTDMAKFVSGRGDMPPMSCLVPVIRRVAAKLAVSRLAIIDSNSPSLLPLCLALYPDAFYYISYRDADVERLTAALVPDPAPHSLMTETQCCDLIVRPCPVEGEAMDEFIRLVSLLNPGGIIVAFVYALSFMDAEPGKNFGHAYSMREKLFSGFELLGAARYTTDPHTHSSHLDFLILRRLNRGGGDAVGFSKTGTGYMPWQRANEFYVNQPGLIFDSRSLFSDATARLI